MENIKLKGAKNIRDLGGVPVEGGVVMPKKLLRGSHLAAISDEDSHILVNEYDLKSVIDLRTQVEKEELPDVRMFGVEYLEMPIFDASLPGLSHEKEQDERDVNNIPNLQELYKSVMNSECVNNLAEIIRKIVLEDNGGAYLYHCTEGKDRTGMVSAILLLLLGADRKAIVDDYLFTNTINEKKAKKYYRYVRYIKLNKTAAQNVYDVFIAKEEYINEILLAVDEYGGIDEFRKNILKLTEADVSAFRERVVEPN